MRGRCWRWEGEEEVRVEVEVVKSKTHKVTCHFMLVMRTHEQWLPRSTGKLTLSHALAQVAVMSSSSLAHFVAIGHHV